MKYNLEGIKGFNNFKEIKQIDIGWSEDVKYYVKTDDDTELLIRISEADMYDKKKSEYMVLNESKDTFTHLNISRVRDFGRLKSGEVYLVFTWIKGVEALYSLNKLTKQEQFDLGIEAGKILKQIHSINPPQDIEDWESHFNKKIDRKIKNYYKCGVSNRSIDIIIEYINKNRYLLRDRPQTLHHGDFHIGNMVLDDKKLGIIDFNRLDYGDPWEEFNRITWCADVSHHFATGRILGYFDYEVPENFFKLMSIYIGLNQVSSIPWALEFGEADYKEILRQLDKVMIMYDNYNTFIPKWYEKVQEGC